MTKKYFLLLLLFAIPGCRSRRGPAPMPCTTTCAVEPVCDSVYVENQQPCHEAQVVDHAGYMQATEAQATYENQEYTQEYVEEQEPSDVEDFEFDIEEEVLPTDTENEQATDEALQAVEQAVAELEANDTAAQTNEAQSEKVAQGDFKQRELKPIYYAYNSKTLSADQNDILKEDLQMAKELSEEGYEIVVRGHSCRSGGTESYNDKISKQRADAVANYFKKHGVNAKVEACGSRNPLVAFGNKTEQAMNRRVEILALANS